MGNDAWPKLMLDTQCGAAHMLSGFGTVFERAQGGARSTQLWSVGRGAADAPTAFNSCGRPIRNEARSCGLLRSGATAEIYELSDCAALFRGAIGRDIYTNGS